jgi:hypothetical protein
VSYNQQPSYEATRGQEVASQTISRPSLLIEVPTTEIGDTQPDGRDVAGQPERSRSSSTSQARSTSFRTGPQPDGLPDDPGSRLRTGIGKPPPLSLAGRPPGVHRRARRWRAIANADANVVRQLHRRAARVAFSSTPPSSFSLERS